MKFTQLTSLVLALAGTTLAQDFCQSAQHSGEKKTETGNAVGNIGSVGYELWADSGNNSATFYSDGSFSCTFQNAGDYLCRSGLSFDSTQTYDQIGQLNADFKLVKENIQNVGYSYVGVYGWTRDPLVEYYIVDNWLSPDRPGDWVGEKNQGDFTIDGAQYTVYENTRFGPSIDGDTQFKQYFSIRKEPRECGSIDITAHFKQWEQLGMKMGKLHEAKVLGEAGNGNGGVSGTADFPYAKVYSGGAAPGGGAAPAAPAAPGGGNAPTTPPADPNAPVTPPADGNAPAAPPADNGNNGGFQAPQGDFQQGGFQPPQGGDFGGFQQGGFQPPQGGDFGGFQQGGFQPPQGGDFGGFQQGGFQPPQGGDFGGFPQGGFQPPQGGDFGGFPQGGFQPPQGGDFGGFPQGGFQPPQGGDFGGFPQGGFQPPQGDFQQGGFPQGGFQPPQDGNPQWGAQPPQWWKRNFY